MEVEGMETVKVGIIGYGYWGPNIARNFAELPGSEVVAIADLREEQLNRARLKFPRAVFTRTYQDLFDLGLDAVVVATPPVTHYRIAKDCLEQGLHVLVEKPLTVASLDAEHLVELAEARGLVLMVGHTFHYNTGVHALKAYIDSGELGEIRYIDTARLNLGLYQRDTNVIWDLATHDVSILLHLLNQDPVSVSAQADPCVIEGVYDLAYLNLLFPSGIPAYVHVSWLDPCKVRRVTVVGSKKMAVFNDMAADGKIRIYDRGIQIPPYTNGFSEFQFNYHHGDVTIPSIPFSEPLRGECQDLIDAILKHTRPRSDGRDGLRVVRILEAAHTSIENRSAHKEIQW
jgi:predicted dehydrogenase